MVTERIKMTVEMEVTEPQALALQAMFNFWNRCGSAGASRNVGFFVDGDGNFKPKCKVSFDQPIAPLTEELAAAACGGADTKNLGQVQYTFDFDPIAWKLREMKRKENNNEQAAGN